MAWKSSSVWGPFVPSRSSPQRAFEFWNGYPEETNARYGLAALREPSGLSKLVALLAHRHPLRFPPRLHRNSASQKP